MDLYLRDVLTEKSDIWALGCILYTLCYLNHPFQNAGSLGILSAKLLFPAVSSVLPDTITVIQRMLDVSKLWICDLMLEDNIEEEFSSLKFIISLPFTICAFLYFSVHARRMCVVCFSDSI